MDALLKALSGMEVSASTVSRITERLDAKVRPLKSAPIREPIVYLYLDATFVDARWARKVENVSALVAYGVDTAEKRRLLGVSIGSEESEDSWSQLLGQLCERGLQGVKLVIGDDHKKMEAGIRCHLPEAERQRRTVHLLRNVLHKVPQRLRKRMASRFSQLFKAKGPQEAQQLRAKLAGEFGSLIPGAFEILDRSWTPTTRFYRFPKEPWQRIRTTNGLERLHAEIKRRVKAVGIFPDRDSARRLVTAVALQSAETRDSRRYLDMSLLEHPGQMTGYAPCAPPRSCRVEGETFTDFRSAAALPEAIP